MLFLTKKSQFFCFFLLNLVVFFTYLFSSQKHNENNVFDFPYRINENQTLKKKQKNSINNFFINQITNDFQNQIKNFDKKIEELKDSVFFVADKEIKELKKKIPYLVDEKIIKKKIQNLPNSNDFEDYFIKVKKENDNGKIIVFAYGVTKYFDQKLLKIISYKKLIKKWEISDFKKFNTKQIISERSLKIFLNIKSSENLKEKNIFTHAGSGFVLSKDENLPKYYVATNKHVVNYFFKNNFYKVGKTTNLEPVYLSKVDYENNYYGNVNKNLKQYISFSNEDNLNNSHVSNIIKSVKLSSDFSKPNEKNLIINNKMSKIFNLNNEYKDSINIDLINEKINLDLVILTIEFNSEKEDIFNHWWSERPTQVRGLEKEDLTFLEYSKNKHEFSNYLISSGYPIFSNSCDQKNKVNHLKKIKITTGLSNNSPYLNEFKNYSSYSNYSYDGKIIFENVEEQMLSGASGSPVFDSNLNLIGILTSGSFPAHGTECANEKNDLFNIFHWLYVDSKILNKSTTKIPLELDKFNIQIPSYKLEKENKKFILKKLK